MTLEEIERYSLKGALKRAYRRQVLRTHPDRGGDEELFKKVVEQYQIAESNLHQDIVGKDVLVMVNLDLDDVRQLLRDGYIELSVRVKRTRQLSEPETIKKTVRVSLEEIGQVVVLEGLGQEGYPDGDLAICFNQVDLGDSVLVFGN